MAVTALMRRPVEWLRSYWLGPFSLAKPREDASFFKNLFRDGPVGEAGVIVDQASAFTHSAVFDAVNQISSDVAKLPLNLLKRRPEGGSDHYVDSKTYDLLKTEPNPEMDSMVFRRTLQAHALTWHGGFAEIERDQIGRPAALWPLEPHRVSPDRVGGELVYRVRDDDGTETVLPAADVIHIRGLGYCAERAYSLIDKARAAIGLALAAERFGAAFFGNGSTFGGIVTAPPDVRDDEDLDRIRKMLKERHQGPDKAHQFLLLYGGLQYTKTGVDPDKAQMDALRSKQIEEVARFFNMPVHKLKNLDRATNNNIEQQDLEYYKGCLLNWITLWEGELNRKLIPRLERRQQFIKHNVNAFLRGDMASRAAFYGALLDRGVFNADMVLEWEDLNPQPNGQGGLYLVQGAMLPKDKLAELADAKIAADQAKNEAIERGAEADVSQARGEADGLRAQLARAETAAADARAVAQSQAGEVAHLRATSAPKADLDEAHAKQAKAEALAEQLVAIVEALRADVARVSEHDRAMSGQVVDITSRLTQTETRAVDAERRAVSAEQAQAEAVAGLEEARGAVTRLTAAQTEAEAALTALRASQAASEARVATLEAERQAAVTAAATATAAADAIQAEARALTAQADEIRAKAETDTADRAALAAQLAAVTADRDAAQQLATEATAERLRLEGEARAATSRAAEAASALEDTRTACVTQQADVARLTAQLAEAMATAAAAVSTASEAERRAQTATAERDAARTEANAAQQALSTHQAATIQAETARSADEDARTASVLAAHRTLAAHTMRLMVERETERARRAQGSVEKLRTWAETWYDGHEALMVEALTPVLAVHVAWVRSTEAPSDLARAYARAHVEESRRQLSAVLDGEAHALAGSIAQLFQRWESERPEAFATDLFQKELTYVRRSSAA